MNSIFNIIAAMILLLIGMVFAFSSEEADLNNVCTAIYIVGGYLILNRSSNES